MHDSWSVEVLRKRNETIQPEITTIWVGSGRYDSLQDAEVWMQHVINSHPKDVLGVRIKKHTWSSEVVLQEIWKEVTNVS